MTLKRFSLVGVALAVAAVVAVIAATSGASTKKASQTLAASSALSLRQTPLGPTLVDANGRALYLFQADKPNLSKLSAAGQAVWPPFTATKKPQAQGGVTPARIGTIPQPGGGFQITYNAHPLYYYVGDHSAGQTHGQGLNEFGALWYALGAAGNAITAAPSNSAPASSSTGGGAYTY